MPKACGSFALSERILGGNMTDIGEYPWVALLIYNTSLYKL